MDEILYTLKPFIHETLQIKTRIKDLNFQNKRIKAEEHIYIFCSVSWPFKLLGF